MVAARFMRLSSPRQGSARHFPHCDQRGIAMTDTALQAPPIEPAARTPGPNLDKGFNPLTLILFMGVMAAGLLYVVYRVYSDLEATGTTIPSYLPSLLLLPASL